MTSPSTAHHTTSFCHNPSCTCPDYEPTAPLDGTSSCDTCSHRREWHFEHVFRLDPLLAREMKARGQETLEHCKALEAGKGCGCPIFVQEGEKLECELCGHKKGWHKWKQTSVDQGPTSPLRSDYASSTGSDPGSPTSQGGLQHHASTTFSHFPFPPTSPASTMQHMRSISPVAPTASGSSFGQHHSNYQHSSSGDPYASPSHLLQAPIPPQQYPYHPHAQQSFSPAHQRSASSEAYLSSPYHHVHQMQATNFLQAQHVQEQSNHSSQLVTPPRSTQSDESGDLEDDFEKLRMGKTRRTYWNDTKGKMPNFDVDSNSGSIIREDHHSPPPADIQPRHPPYSSPLPRREFSYTSADVGIEESALDPDYYLSEPAQPSGLGPMPSLLYRGGLGHRERHHHVGSGSGSDGRTNSGTPSNHVEARNARSNTVGQMPESRRNLQMSGDDLMPLAALSTSPIETREPGRALQHSISAPVTAGYSMRARPDAAVKSTWEQFETKSKHLTLSISPPLTSVASRRRSHAPGQIFTLKLELGSKVSSSSYEKLWVRLVGNSVVHGEPPDDHDFLEVRRELMPSVDEGVEMDLGGRCFNWTITLPKDQGCHCRDQALSLPASYSHSNFKIEYAFELFAKQKGLFHAAEKLRAKFTVEAPYVEDLVLSKALALSSHTSIGKDGLWTTVNVTYDHRGVGMENTPGKIWESQLAWQIVPTTAVDSPTVKIAYRVTLALGHSEDTPYIDAVVLKKLQDHLRVSLSRRCLLTTSGKSKGSSSHHKEVALPTLRVNTLVELKGQGHLIRQSFNDGIWRNSWRMEGSIEISRNEAKSLATCAVSVKYILTAQGPKTIGLTEAIEIIARNLNLEIINIDNSSTSHGLPPIPTHSPPSTTSHSEHSFINSFPQSLQRNTSAPTPPIASGSGSTHPPVPSHRPPPIPTPTSKPSSVVSITDLHRAESTTSNQSRSSNHSHHTGVGSEQSSNLAHAGVLDFPPDFDEFEPGEEEAPPPFEDYSAEVGGD